MSHDARPSVMPFNSFTFVLFFFAVVLIHSLPLPGIVRKLNLLVASYLFYAAWEPWFVTLLLYATAVNWIAGKLLQAWDHLPAAARSCSGRRSFSILAC